MSPSLILCGVVSVSLRRGFVTVSLRVCLVWGDPLGLRGDSLQVGLQMRPCLTVPASLANDHHAASLGPQRVQHSVPQGVNWVPPAQGREVR